MTSDQKPVNLTEKELAAVAGGHDWERKPPGLWEDKAREDGRLLYVPIICGCNAQAGGQYSMYAKKDVLDYPPEIFYRDVKCYACFITIKEMDSHGYTTIF